MYQKTMGIKNYSNFQNRIKHRFSKPYVGIVTPGQNFRIDHYSMCLPTKTNFSI